MKMSYDPYYIPQLDIVFASSVVRLYGGNYGYEGMVLVYVNGTWGAVCPAGWDDADFRVVCRQLGFRYIAL